MDEVQSTHVAEDTVLKATGTGTVQLPPGMTQEEADRLVREADDKEN